MSKENLKFSLKQQSLSFAQDVADKLAYLKSDNVFNQIERNMERRREEMERNFFNDSFFQ